VLGRKEFRSSVRPAIMVYLLLEKNVSQTLRKT